MTGSYRPTPAYWQYDIRGNNSSAVGAKAVVNSETSKIMPWTAAYEQIAEVRVAALHGAADDPKRPLTQALKCRIFS
jgi:hypothetical protein